MEPYPKYNREQVLIDNEIPNETEDGISFWNQELL